MIDQKNSLLVIVEVLYYLGPDYPGNGHPTLPLVLRNLPRCHDNDPLIDIHMPPIRENSIET